MAKAVCFWVEGFGGFSAGGAARALNYPGLAAGLGMSGGNRDSTALPPPASPTAPATDIPPPLHPNPLNPTNLIPTAHFSRLSAS